MSTGRLEAFSDGVIAIVITILVLNLTPPKGDSLKDLLGIEHGVFIYLLSFSLVAIYWLNHHHLFQVAKKINSKVLWANIFFLFSLTLFPFSTAWISEHLFSLFPQLLYGLVICLADCAFLLMVITLSKSNEEPIIKADFRKTVFSILLNIVALILGIVINPIMVCLVNLLMILLWISPNKKIEHFLG
ncbi:TMEM175 family protein [Vagococcus elongatus]|uniref:DUF1211 domain-containing membrane protein n=1 Tax=Vagococcus elongatus TaxID=180344 RepID=A0A430ATY1_9ENTE|nr:TMEM175 family protein [Vagococcus elongatus]RSU11529.1 hypothetical protein CBF29_07545 [Vagococcus elongatus]